MTTLELIEWSALLIGTSGTIIWALRIWVGVEAWLWLASGLLWIVFAAANGHEGLAVRDVIGIILYVTGIVTSFRNKRDLKRTAAAPVPEAAV